MGDMDDAPSLPTDVTACHRLLLAAYQQVLRLEQQATQATHQAAQAGQRVAQAEQQVDELQRVLDATADSYEKLHHEHTAVLDELAWYKRWVHGQRRERIVEGEGQRHLFDLSVEGNLEAPVASEPRDEVAGSWIFPVCHTTGTNWTYHLKKKSAIAAGAPRIVLVKTSPRFWNMCRRSWKSMSMCVPSTLVAIARTEYPVRRRPSDRSPEVSPVRD